MNFTRAHKGDETLFTRDLYIYQPLFQAHKGTHTSRGAVRMLRRAFLSGVRVFAHSVARIPGKPKPPWVPRETGYFPSVCTQHPGKYTCVTAVCAAHAIICHPRAAAALLGATPQRPSSSRSKSVKRACGPSRTLPHAADNPPTDHHPITKSLLTHAFGHQMTPGSGILALEMRREFRFPNRCMLLTSTPQHAWRV